jgi:putative heme-binding domain-containing protein
VNEELVEMCAALGSSTFVPKALDLLERAATQEEQVLYSGALLQAPEATWDAPSRERFLRLAVARVPSWKGGSQVKGTREKTLGGAKKLLSATEQTQFAELLASTEKPAPTLALAPREFVKAWKTEDFAGGLDSGLKKHRNLENGKGLFSATGCVACHSFQGEGGMAGPDLTSAGGRYSGADLLDNILNPHRVINEQYTLSRFAMKDGTEIVGRIVNMSGDMLIVALNPMDPSVEKRFRKSEVQSTSIFPLSFMPEGLLNTLTQEDVLDLLAYLLDK